MERILNFRQVGLEAVSDNGKKIKNIYRSADVSNATNADVEQLLALGINDIIDLRSAEEITTVLADDQLRIKNIDIIGNGKQNQVEQFSPQNLANLMTDLYQKSFVETEGFKAELEYILSLEGKPFLFHCTAGKDRTGITAAILMHLLGFSYTDIKDEYLEIDEALVTAMLGKLLSHLKPEEREHLDSLRAIASVSESFLEAYLLGITDEYGTVDKYVQTKLKVDPKMIATLKDYYLE